MCNLLRGTSGPMISLAPGGRNLRPAGCPAHARHAACPGDYHGDLRHPPSARRKGWRPMDRQYDLVVVGTGVTSAVASRCREAGWSVAVVDYRPFGGTCALRGCIPKKILVSAAEAVHGARTMADRGVRPEIGRASCRERGEISVVAV